MLFIKQYGLLSGGSLVCPCAEGSFKEWLKGLDSDGCAIPICFDAWIKHLLFSFSFESHKNVQTNVDALWPACLAPL